MNLARGPLVVVHAVFATVVVISFSMHLREREGEVAQVKQTAHQERQETVRLEQDIAQQEALLDGLRRKDPYVVELIARERLKYATPGEIAPPPLPAIDKPRATDTK